MGSTRKFEKKSGKDANAFVSSYVTLTCGCSTNEPPTISSPVKKWLCCGDWQKVRR